MPPHLTDGAGPGKQVVKALLRATSDGADDDDDNKLVATHELFGLMVPACLRRLWTRVKSWILELRQLHQYCIVALRDMYTMITCIIFDIVVKRVPSGWSKTPRMSVEGDSHALQAVQQGFNTLYIFFFRT